MTTALFILVADERSGKLLRRLASGELAEEWTMYAADDCVRSLGQSPDTRELTARPITPASTRVANEAFVAELASRLREACEGDDVKSILVIPRDKTELSDSGLRKLVDETLAIYS
jgi:hypothetical protein